MATIATQQIKQNGTAPTYAAASGGGDEFTPGNHVFFHLKNGGGSSVTATFVTPGTAFGQPIADVAVTVGAGTDQMIGPFPAEEFKGNDGLVAVTYSAVTTVTVAVLTT